MGVAVGTMETGLVTVFKLFATLGEFWGLAIRLDKVLLDCKLLTGFCSICLKKGKERLPQPGILTSQPVEISNKSINIAEKIERLLKVSRNGSFPESVLVEVFSQFKFTIGKSQ
jgi:hypothetical protein